MIRLTATWALSPADGICGLRWRASCSECRMYCRWTNRRTTSNIESIIWLEQFLKSFPGALLMTSHDREFMNRLVSKIAEIDGGEIITYSGDYDFYEREKAVRESNQQAAFAPAAINAGERAALHRSVSGTARRQAAQVQSRIKALDKVEKIELPKKRQVVEFKFRVPPRSGEQVAVLEICRRVTARV